MFKVQFKLILEFNLAETFSSPWPDQLLSLVSLFFHLKKCELFKIESVYNNKAISPNRKTATNCDSLIAAFNLATRLIRITIFVNLLLYKHMQFSP